MTIDPIKNIRKGDIILVDFKKNKGSEQNGVRPAIVVQNDIGNTHSPTTIVCPLTLQIKKTEATHVALLPEECGILAPSTVLCEQIRAIDKSRIRRKVGQIRSAAKMSAIERTIILILNLFPLR